MPYLNGNGLDSKVTNSAHSYSYHEQSRQLVSFFKIKLKIKYIFLNIIFLNIYTKNIFLLQTIIKKLSVKKFRQKMDGLQLTIARELLMDQLDFTHKPLQYFFKIIL